MPPLSKSSALSLLLTLSLLFPSVSLALEGSLGGEADGSQYGGDTDTDASTSEGPGSGPADSDSPSESGPGPGMGEGTDGQATSDVANQAQADAAAAASYGMTGEVDVNATVQARQDGTIDNDQVAMKDGSVQSLSAGAAAYDAIQAANAVGGYVDPAATQAAYQNNPDMAHGTVVGATTGTIGYPAAVAKAEIQAQANIDAVAAINNSAQTAYDAMSKNLADAINNAVNPNSTNSVMPTDDTRQQAIQDYRSNTNSSYQQGLAQSFYSGPKGTPTGGLNTAAQNAANNAGKYSYDSSLNVHDLDNPAPEDLGGWVDQNGRNIGLNNVSTDIADKLGSLTESMKNLNKDGVNYSATIDVTKSTVTTKSINPASQTYGTTNTYDIKTGKQVSYSDPNINSTAAAPVGPANRFTPADLGKYSTTKTTTQAITTVAPTTLTPVKLDCSGGCPRGIRNNNPLNIVHNSTNDWKGAATNKDDTFVNFQTPQHGIRAGVVTMNSYVKQGYDTLAEVIGKWAPPTENDTNAYVDAVSKQTGIAPNDKIDLSNTKQVSDLVEAMITHENGKQPYSRDVVEQGVNMAQQDRGLATNFGSSINSALTSPDSLFDNTPKGYEFGGDKTTNPGNNTVGRDPSDNTNNDDIDSTSNTNTNPGRTAGTIAGATIAGPIGAILGGLFGGWVGNQNWSPGGNQTNKERGRDSNTSMRLCPPYPLSCQGGAAILALPSLSSVSDWWNGLWNTEVETVAEPEVESIQVLITVNNQTGEVEVNRPDVLASLSAPALYYQNEEQYDAMIKLLNETPILFGTDGEVVYSNGLYSPPVINGEALEGEIPEYIYAVEYLNENGELIAIDDNDSALPDNLATNVVRSVLGNATPFYTSDIASATYRLVEPNQDIPGDEYYDYVITLNDGTVKAITVPQFTSTAYMQKRFGEIGFKGNAVDIVTLATETKELPEQGLISRLFNFVSDQADKFMDVKQTDDTVTELPTIGTGITTEDIEKVFIYPATDISCPTDVEGYETGFMYTAIIKDRTTSDYIYMVSDGRCGTGSPVDLVIETARHLDIAYGVEGATYDSIVNKTFFLGKLTHFEQEVVRVYRPVTTTTPVEVEDPVIEPATTTPAQKPNLTNDVTLEVKAVGSDGAVLTDWTPATKMTISSDVQLYFRWDGSSYQQCLPFLHDGGTYALTRQDRAMLRGNTESEGFNITERTASYKIECGGQRNDEFGVDERVVEVVVQ